MSKARIDTIPMSVPMRPMQSSSVASRCVCMVCGDRPNVESSGGQDGAPITLKVACCGLRETRTLTRSELTFTQKFFGDTTEDET